MRKVLKILGLAEISLAKKANMTNCVKRVMLTRDRCISMLKMDKFLADANWDLVQEGTAFELVVLTFHTWTLISDYFVGVHTCFGLPFRKM